MNHEHPLLKIGTSPIHGRGLYARTRLPKGTTLLVTPLLVLSPDDTERLKATRLNDYVFWVQDAPDGRPIHAVAFGMISMCNHRQPPNATFSADPDTMMVTLKAAEDLPAGAELFIDYGEHAEEMIARS